MNDSAVGWCAAGWGVCPLCGPTLKSSGSGAWCQECGRRWEEDLLSEDCRLPAAGVLTQFAGDPGIALCLPHGRAGAVLVAGGIFTTG